MNVRSRRLRTIALTVAGLIAVYGIVGGLVAPPIAKRMLATRLGERLGRVVVVDDVTINPYTLRAAIQGLRVLEPDGKAVFAAFDRLDVNGSAASFYRLAPVVEGLTLTGLKVHAVRDSETHYNLSDILERSARLARAAPAERKPRPFRFSVSNIRVVNGTIDFEDRPHATTQRLSEVQVAIPFISNLPTDLKDQVKPAFSANINGTPLQLTGEALPFQNTITTHLNVDVTDLDVPHYLAYLPADFPVKMGSGKLDARISLRFVQAPDREPTVDLTGTAALSDVALATAEGPLARFARVETTIASLDPLGGNVQLASLRLSGASAMGGDWSVPSAEARDIAVDVDKHAVRVASLTSADGKLALKRKADGTFETPRLPPGDEHSPPWAVALGKLALTGYAVSVLDATVRPAADHRLTVASLEASDLSTEQGFKGSATARVRLAKGGVVDVESTFALDPFVVKASVDARSVDLVPLRAYVAQFPTVALKSGTASAKGTLSLQGKGDAMRVAYAGTAQVANLATLDTANHEELLDWKSVSSRGIRFEYAPNAPLELAVAEVAVDKAYSRIVVTPAGKLNVQELLAAGPGEPAAAASPRAAPPPPASPRKIRIDRITFANSRLNFTDHFIKPNYTADVGALHGSVARLSSDPASRATVTLLGSWDSASPVTIAGTINPLRGDLFLDIGAKGEDIDLTKLTAYSQRYAGYGITAGRLTLDVKYHVENGKMEGRNRIVVDQLTFGEKVDSPEATKLPVLFAINLLKDSKGRIDLELPISGSLEDPKFELGALIAQMFSSPFRTAATSPFSLIASAQGGDDLAFVEFEPGLAAVTPAARTKLDTLVKLLQDRPGVKLELAARLDPVRDVEALKAAALQSRLAAAPKDLSKEAKEKLLQEPVAVGEAELAALSAQRLEAVKAYLTAADRLPAERVVVGTAPAKEGTKAKPSRVDFALR